jgi:hypothetical protein
VWGETGINEKIIDGTAETSETKQKRVGLLNEFYLSEEEKEVAYGSSHCVESR